MDEEQVIACFFRLLLVEPCAAVLTNQAVRGIMTLILGRKEGMTQFFADDGTHVGVSVVTAGPCVVTQVRTEENDGYNAVQLGFGDTTPKRTRKPQQGHFEKAGSGPKKLLREERIAAPSDSNLGDVVDVTVFKVGDIVDVVGTTKGRGFAGTIKRHGFARGPKTHGSMNYRAPGSIGAASSPSRVFRGKRMGGHYGASRKTIKNLEIVRIDTDRNLLFIKGSVPGPNGGYLQVRTAKTGLKQPAKGKA
ncbi:MAG: large subunit ribosomal protein L3 [Gammaproteobacteria bacterium]